MNISRVIKPFAIYSLFTIITYACLEGKNHFDFSVFEEHGLTDYGKKKYLTYINVTGHDFSGLDFPCIMYAEHLERYRNSSSIDILFIIEADKRDSSKVEELLVNWCFEKYLITYDTPLRFQTARKQGVKAISFLFDKYGNEIALTNPSFINFHKLLNQ